MILSTLSPHSNLKVKNHYDDTLWEKGCGYYDGIGKKCECSMDTKMDCSIVRDIMCAWLIT
jgi:hypothetical protein